MMLADDLGFADLGCYGGEIDTPHLDALAGARVAVHRLPFHTPVLAHPGSAADRTKRARGRDGPSRALRRRGSRGTATSCRSNSVDRRRCSGTGLGDADGREVAPVQERRPAPKPAQALVAAAARVRPVLRVPRGLTNFHHPHRLYEDNTVIETDQYPDGYYLTDDLTDRAVRMIREVKAADPAKPFFPTSRTAPCTPRCTPSGPTSRRYEASTTPDGT